MLVPLDITNDREICRARGVVAAEAEDRLRHRRQIPLIRPCHPEVTVTGTAVMELSRVDLGVTRTRTAAQMDAV